MIKRILRAGLGVVFFFVFLSFLLVGALKFRVLSPSFWKTALDKGGVYQQLQNQITESLSQSRESVRQQGGPTGMSKEMLRLLYIDKELTADRFRELIETNLDRLLGYVNGKSKELVLYLPVKEWDLPVVAFGQPALAKLNAQTPVEDAFQIVGMKPEQTKPIIEGLGQVKTILGYLTLVWITLLLLTVGIGAGHYFLGVGLTDRIGGTAWLLLISGFVAKLIGVGAGSIFEMITANSKPPMALWMAELGRSLVGQFFNLGATLGLVTGIAGLGVVVAVIYLTKLGKLKEEKEKLSLKKRIFAFVLGVILGLVVLGTAFAGLIVAFGGKVDLSVGGGSIKLGSQTETENRTVQTIKEETPRLSDDVYKSEKGWEINFPAGWEAVKTEKSEGVIKKPVAGPTDWAMIEVSSLAQGKVADTGNYLKLFKESLAAGKSGLENPVLVEDPYEEKQEETGLTRFVFIIDFDGVIAKINMRQRFYMVEYRTQSGVGFVIKARVPVESWEKYEKIIKESVDTFSIVK
ncbi:hypothetical protein HYU91_04390 [Candidatus Collierbacteria bacterium]|nr:hypothetical protein [Candidatus Collierbacteria bacterium]